MYKQYATITFNLVSAILQVANIIYQEVPYSEHDRSLTIMLYILALFICDNTGKAPIVIQSDEVQMKYYFVQNRLGDMTT